jgi:hypothetical protein
MSDLRVVDGNSTSWTTHQLLHKFHGRRQTALSREIGGPEPLVLRLLVSSLVEGTLILAGQPRKSDKVFWSSSFII